MENHPIETLAERAEQFAKTNLELYRLKAIDKSAEAASSLTMRLVLITFFLFFFLILNIGLALWIGAETRRVYCGFFIVAGFYAILGVVLYIYRDKWIKSRVRNSIITKALN